MAFYQCNVCTNVFPSDSTRSCRQCGSVICFNCRDIHTAQHSMWRQQQEQQQQQQYEQYYRYQQKQEFEPQTPMLPTRPMRQIEDVVSPQHTSNTHNGAYESSTHQLVSRRGEVQAQDMTRYQHQYQHQYQEYQHPYQHQYQPNTQPQPQHQTFPPYPSPPAYTQDGQDAQQQEEYRIPAHLIVERKRNKWKKEIVTICKKPVVKKVLIGSAVATTAIVTGVVLGNCLDTSDMFSGGDSAGAAFDNSGGIGGDATSSNVASSAATATPFTDTTGVGADTSTYTQVPAPAPAPTPAPQMALPPQIDPAIQMAQNMVLNQASMMWAGRNALAGSFIGAR